MIGEKCEINNFDVLTVKDELLAKNIVSSTKAAMTTASYVALWQCGQTFDFEKSAVKSTALCSDSLILISRFLLTQLATVLSLFAMFARLSAVLKLKSLLSIATL